MDYSVNINVFQGPFELLYHLIEKKEIDIYDIPISEITDQYLEYLEEMMQFNMNVASEFILMAASLIEIKSQMLLPQKEKEEDPRQELVAQLLEYKIFKDLSEELKKYEEETTYYITKPREEMALTSDSKTEQLFLNEINVYELYNVYLSLLKKQNFKIAQKEKDKIYRENYRVIMAISLAVVRWLGSGRPVTLVKTVSFMPNSLAFSFIALTQLSSDPYINSAMATEASLADLIDMALSMFSTVCTSYASRYIWLPPMPAAFSDMVISWSGVIRPSLILSEIKTMSIIFVMLAGCILSFSFFSNKTRPSSALIKIADRDCKSSGSIP
jgi:segregation and condensation protein A